MNTNRNGKIARLPESIRNELNHRLHAGDRGQPLVVWLNSLPEVRHEIRKSFAGKPITAANLSQWRNGGYRDWRIEHEPKPKPRPEWEARQRQWQPQPCQLQQAQHSPKPPMTIDRPEDEILRDPQPFTDPAEVSDRLAVRLGLELSQFAETWLAGAKNPRERWRRLRELLAALSQLRRGDHRAANVDIAQDRWQAEANDREQRLEEEHDKKAKEAALAPVRAMTEFRPLAEIHGGTELGWKTAAYILETRYNLIPGSLLKKGFEPWRKNEAKEKGKNARPKAQTRKPNARRRTHKPTRVQPEAEEEREEIDLNNTPDSNQNPDDSDPIQSDPGEFPTDSNQS